MKKTNLNLFRLVAITGALFFTFLILFSSCSKDDEPSSGNADYSGTWKISFYFDKVDETSDFAGYNFSFNNGGILTATNGSTTVNGTWSQTSTELSIDFGTTPVFSDLNGNWLIVEKTASSIKLKDDNPAQDDQLNFLKL